LGEPYPCKARVTIYDTLSKRNIVENNFVHCNDIESGGSFKHSRYQITVHERVYAQKYLDEQNAIQQQKEAEARARADARELEQELRRIADEKKKAEEKILADQQNIISQTIVTPIADIPVTTSPVINDDLDNLLESDFYNRVLSMINLTKPKNYEPKLSLKPKDNNTMLILLGALGIVGLILLKK